jgi:hypothetical protein
MKSREGILCDTTVNHRAVKPLHLEHTKIEGVRGKGQGCLQSSTDGKERADQSIDSNGVSILETFYKKILGGWPSKTCR